VITGFALDDLNGMGITAEPGLLDIFQPFYVQVDLPHSVKLGETLAVEMVNRFFFSFVGQWFSTFLYKPFPWIKTALRHPCLKVNSKIHLKCKKLVLFL
jgi:hypothetical protein